MGDIDEFAKGVHWVSEHFSAAIDRNVSVFETNIRIVGGLLSAHLFATEYLVRSIRCDRHWIRGRSVGLSLRG